MTPARRVSVVIATFNRAALLPDTVRAIAQQSQPPAEIIVVDDGSTDDTRRVVAGLGLPLRYERIANQGPQRARAHGIGLATGDLVAVVDDDDLWLPDKLRSQCAELERSGCRWVYGDAVAFDHETGRDLYRFSDVSRQFSGTVLRQLLMVNFIPSPTVIIERDLLHEIMQRPDKPDVRYGEDWMTWLLAAAQSPVAQVTQIVARYRVHAAGAASRTAIHQRLADSERVLDYCRTVLPAPLHGDIARSRGFARCKAALALWSEHRPVAALRQGVAALVRRPALVVELPLESAQMGWGMMRSKRRNLRRTAP